ncbi:hypothetical protein D3C87_1733630 [compost metagenome]
MKEGVGVDQQSDWRLLEHLAQGDMLGSKMITVGCVPALASSLVEYAHADRQARVGLGIVAEHLDVEFCLGCLAQPGQGTGDAEQCFLVVGLGAESQVNQLRARWG